MAGTKSPNNCPNCKTDSLDSHIGMQLSTKLTVEFCTQCGYVGEYNVERLWRDSKLLEIGGGTLESHHKNITRDLFKTPEVVNN